MVFYVLIMSAWLSMSVTLWWVLAPQTSPLCRPIHFDIKKLLTRLEFIHTPVLSADMKCGISRITISFNLIRRSCATVGQGGWKTANEMQLPDLSAGRRAERAILLRKCDFVSRSRRVAIGCDCQLGILPPRRDRNTPWIATTGDILYDSATKHHTEMLTVTNK